MRKVFILFCILIGFIYVQIFLPISNFPVDKSFIVKKGESEQVVYSRLESEGFIRSALFAKGIARIFPENSVQIGEYSWGQKQSVWQILNSLRIKPKSIKITIPEGYSKYQIADKFSSLKNFDPTEFLLRAEEGYLFPETYYFYTFTSTGEVLDEMRSEFTKQTTKNLDREPTRDEVVIASILEREARGSEDMKIVAGIIKNRLAIGMPLQIDATVLYGMGVWKDKVNYKDLENNSSFNTYKNKGLPSGPISNPGIKSLRAAMNPTPSKYIYYLTGKDGKMYYSTTLESHNRFKALYLK